MRFTKMHGAGNDYVFVDCFAQPPPEEPAELARAVSDRHFGIGGDGLILIRPSDAADARMQMFNADGSEAEMCGNGIRCVAKYVHEHGLCDKETLQIETGAGILTLELEVDRGTVRRVRVDMGEPVVEMVETPITLPDKTLKATCVRLGNPHCVTFVEQLTDEWVLGIGPQLETHSQFPRRVNAEFVRVISPGEVHMRVWERGSGETLACGTGACAACVAGVVTKRTDRRILAHLSGGDLELHWAETNNHVYMTGPAVEVFSGDWNR